MSVSIPDPAVRGQLGGLSKAANLAVQRLVAARVEQGLPPLVVDPTALYAIAQAIGLIEEPSRRHRSTRRVEAGTEEAG